MNLRDIVQQRYYTNYRYYFLQFEKRKDGRYLLQLIYETILFEANKIDVKEFGDKEIDKKLLKYFIKGKP